MIELVVEWGVCEAKSDWILAENPEGLYTKREYRIT